MIRAIFVFLGAYVAYGFLYAFWAEQAFKKSGWAAQVSIPAPMSLWGAGIVLAVTWLVCHKK